MLGEIPLGFPWIPREPHESSITPVPSLSAAIMAVARRCLTYWRSAASRASTTPLLAPALSAARRLQRRLGGLASSPPGKPTPLDRPRYGHDLARNHRQPFKWHRRGPSASSGAGSTWGPAVAATTESRGVSPARPLIIRLTTSVAALYPALDLNVAARYLGTPNPALRSAASSGPRPAQQLASLPSITTAGSERIP